MRKEQEKKSRSLLEEEPGTVGVEDPGRAQPVDREPGETGNVEKIRDILFGAQMQDYEQRFDELEERVLVGFTDLKQEAKRNFESLEVYVKKELESLTSRLKGEHDDRAESVDRVSKEFKGAVDSVETRIGQLDEKLGESARHLRDQILDQSKSLSDEIRQTNEDTLAALDRAAEDLRSGKVDREGLAMLLTELADRVTRDEAQDVASTRKK